MAQVKGSGTTNYVPLWTNSTTIGNSTIYETGGKVGIGKTAPVVTLDSAGSINTDANYQISGNWFLWPGGAPLSAYNTGVGLNALEKYPGTNNTAAGAYTLAGPFTGTNNAALGTFALGDDSGSYNSAFGAFSMGGSSGTSGSYNAAIGFQSMYIITTGTRNVGLGAYALNNNTTGSSNIAIGYDAATNVAAGNGENIHIGNLGVSSDSGVIRIGTAGEQISFFVAGVRGVTTGSNDAVPVLIDSNGQLGTVNSSRRFKEDIQDMGDSTEGLMLLRPVTFRYQKPFADGSKPMQYGLIAEEVVEVYPELVAYSADGQIETVKYQMLDSMLLNEVQRQRAEIQGLQERLAKMEAILARLPINRKTPLGKTLRKSSSPR